MLWSRAEKSAWKKKEKAKFAAARVVSSRLFALVGAIPVAVPRKVANWHIKPGRERKRGYRRGVG